MGCPKMTMKVSRAVKRSQKLKRKRHEKWLRGTTLLTKRWRLKYCGQGHVEATKRSRDKTVALWSYGTGFFTMCLAFPTDYFHYSQHYGRADANGARIKMQVMEDNKSIIDFEARCMHNMVYELE